MNFAALLLLLSHGLQAQRLPAFPDAEGFAKYTSGGRGGRVVYVTHTYDVLDIWSNRYKGSLRAALATPGSDPITIVFKCGGAIELASQLACTRSNVTVAGQTALGDGICIAKYGTKLNGRNIIVRHLRFRPSDDIAQNQPSITVDNTSNVIIDHCSFSWSVEENSNITDCDSITVQWCINSESLYNAGHDKGARAYAAQWGGQRASYHHNLLAHHNSRMPRQNGNTSNDYQLTWDYRNNVHYNWGNNDAFYGGGVEKSGGYSHSNLVNNYYVPGPATTTNKNNQYFCAPSGGRPAVTGEGHEYDYGYGLWWLSGNVMKDNDAKTSDNFSGLSGSQNHWATGEFEIPPEFAVATTSAEEAYRQVIASAGATLPHRCYIDSCVISDVVWQTAARGGAFANNKANSGIIDSPNKGVNAAYRPAKAPQDWSIYRDAYAKVDSAAAPLDTDADGMPDWWENANSLDKNNPDDRNSINASSGGYTMLEVYLNSISETEDEMPDNPTGVAKSEARAQPHLRLYPNPASTSFSIEAVLEPTLVAVYSLAGQKVAEYPANGARTFGVSVLRGGIYVVKVTFANGKVAAQKLVKG